MTLENFIELPIILDFANKYLSAPSLTAVAGEANGRKIRLTITDGGRVQDLTGKTVVFYWKNVTAGNSGMSTFTPADAKDGVFDLFFPTEMLIAGTVNANIQIVDSIAKTMITSRSLTITVEPSTYDAAATEAENNFDALQHLMTDKPDLSAYRAYINQFNEKANQSDLLSLSIEIDSLGQQKADKTEVAKVEEMVSKMPSATPKETFNNLSELKVKYPSGSTSAMLVLESDGVTGYVYLWNGSEWKKGVLYQETGLPEATKKIIENALHGDTIVQNTAEPAPEYKDLNTLKPNTVVNYAIWDDKVLNVPTILADRCNFTVVTLSPINDIKQQSIQILIDRNNRFFYRICWGSNWTTWAISDKWSAQNEIFAPGTLVAPYDNLNTLPVPSTVTYGGRGDVLNAPAGLSDYVITTMSGSGNLSGSMQLLVDKNTGHTYVRAGWGPISNIYFTSWNQLDKEAEISNPQEERYDIPSLSMFGKFGVIGDSFASGSLKVGEEWGGQTDNTTWGAMIARKWGTNMLHLASSGLSTRSWLAHYDGLIKLNSSDAQDIYYCVLGINDYWSLGLDYIGTIDDVESGADTFFGNYGKIIKAIQTKAPKAKIILFGIADPSTVATSFNVAIKALANHFGIPYVDQKTDGLFTSSYYLNNMVGGHPTAPMYAAMALAFERLIKKAVVDNFNYFKDYGL